MWNAEEIKYFHKLSPKSSYPNAIIHMEMRTRQCTSLLFVLTCFGNQGKKKNKAIWFGACFSVKGYHTSHPGTLEQPYEWSFPEQCPSPSLVWAVPAGFSSLFVSGSMETHSGNRKYGDTFLKNLDYCPSNHIMSRTGCAVCKRTRLIWFLPRSFSHSCLPRQFCWCRRWGCECPLRRKSRRPPPPQPTQRHRMTSSAFTCNTPDYPSDWSTDNSARWWNYATRK